ncbi:MAG: hypothetical protein K8R21_10285 [Leptospira sp.]|nr:hypothetical protein [Leptospira sp.]
MTLFRNPFVLIPNKKIIFGYGFQLRKISILITLFLFIGSIAYYFLMDKIWSPDSFQKIYVLKNTDGKILQDRSRR